jgi:hypothetical protein
MNKEEISKLVNELIGLGEDRDELKYWEDIFDYLPPLKQIDLYLNLKKESEALNRT